MPTQLKMPRVRGARFMAVDLAAVTASAALAMALTTRGDLIFPSAMLAALVTALSRFPSNLAFGLYQRIWRHASIDDLGQIAKAAICGSLGAWLLVHLLGSAGGFLASAFTPAYWLLEGLLSAALLGGTRLAVRVAADGRAGRQTGRARPGVPTIVYGAGSAGVQAARAAGHPRSGIHPVAFLDDDPRLWGSDVAGVPVRGDIDQLEAVVEASGARRLLLALPQASGAAIRRIVRETARIGVEVRTIPRIHELLDGTLDMSGIRRVRVEDLLKRPEITDHVDGVRELILGRQVMITGAGGSIGSELARQVFALQPASLILVDRAEGPLYSIQRELELAQRRHQGSGELQTHIANVATRSAMLRLMRTCRPDIIFHAAAYKHVPMMEQHPSDAIQVNVGGTISLLEAAEEYRVPNFVLVSTDKAVHPSSVMGATKRIAEGLVAEAALRTGLRYLSVRFGNVLGSSGSVVPIFQQQLENGDPITITHPEMTRYFMTIPEAVWLILDASAIGSPGDILALDMGEPVRITDLALDLIRLSGLDPDAVPIEYTGLRPGEKLHEQLFYEAEQARSTQNERVVRASSVAGHPRIRQEASDLIGLADGDHDVQLRNDLFAMTNAIATLSDAPATTVPASHHSSSPAMAPSTREA